MAYKSKAMQNWAGENQPSSVENKEYKSSAMRNYEANMAKKAQQEEAERQQELIAQQKAEAPRRATLKDLTVGSLSRGYKDTKYGDVHYNEIMSGREKAKAQRLKEQLDSDKYNFEAQSGLGKAISGASQLVGQQAYLLGNKKSLAAAGAAAGLATGVGAAVPLPEEVVTIPVAVGKGLAAGSAVTMHQVEAANAYDEMVAAGVSDKDAKIVANLIGLGVGALEAIQADKLADSVKLLKGVKGEASQKAATRLAEALSKKQVAKAAGKIAGATAFQTAQEVAQEGVNIAGQNIARKNANVDTISGEEAVQRLKDTAVQSALSFGLMEGVGAVGGAMMNRNNIKARTNEANTEESDADSATNVRKKDATDINVDTTNKTEKRFTNAENSNETAENGLYKPENKALSAENGALTTQPQIATETAVTDDATTLSKKGITLENGQVLPAPKRYGAEGRKAVKTIANATPQKLIEAEQMYRAGQLGQEKPEFKTLSKNESTAMFMAGMADGKTSRTAYEQRQFSPNVKAGLVVETAQHVPEADRQTYNKIGLALGVRIRFAEAKELKGSNAKYDTKTNEIVISKDTEFGAKIALAHEIVHELRIASPKEYEALAKAVMEYEQRIGVADRDVAAHARTYEADKGKIDYYDMLEETVADFVAKYADSDSFAEMLAKEPTLRDKVVQIIKDIIRKLQKMVVDKDTRKLINEWENVLKQLENAVKATEAKVTQYPADAKIGDDSFVVNEVRESRKSATYDIAQDEMRQDLVKYGIFTEAESYQFVNSISKLIDEVITPNAAILDMNEDFDRDDRKNISYKPNSDSLYKVSLDFSTLCKKRLMSQYVTEQLQLRLGRAITNKEQLAIRDRLLELKKENDSIEVACALCYVEAARLKSPVQINRFLKDRTGYMTKYFAKANKEFDAKVKQMQIDMKVERGYDADATISKLPQKDKNAINDATRKMRMAYKPSAEEMAVIEIANSLDDRAFLTLGNLEKLAEEQPDIYKAFAGHVASSTRSKELQGNTAYYYGDSRREGVSDALIALMNAENGLRHQSWSDFQSIHLLDTIVAIAELSTRKAKMQAYTKVPNFVKLVGRTGMMINLSLIPDGRTGFINGKLAFSNIEGMDFETAKKLRDTYANTTGTIAIGINDQQIKALLASGEIDYVIPYHASGLNKELRRIVKLESWDDYQNKQSEKKIEGYANLANNPDWHKKPDFSEWFKADEIDTTKDGVTIMREAAERYKQLCRERGLKPKFDDFKNEPNYWKLLIDRKMVDHKTGKIIMQEAVRPVFDFDVITEMLNEEVQSYDANLNERLMDTLVGFYGDGGKNSEISQRIKQLDKEGKAREAAKKKGIYEAYEQFPMIDVAVADERYSRKAYHAGDLGKAESRFNQDGGRHTGHFGTGTYFVGDKSELQYGYAHRPVEEVDFDNYHLFRPLYAGQGLDLHNALSVVNNFGANLANWIDLGENRWKIDREYGDLVYDYEVNATKENAEKIDKFLLDKGIMTEERLDHEKNQRREYPLWYTYEEIQKDYFGSDGEISSKYDKARKAVWELKFIFDKSEEEILDRIAKAKAEVDNSKVDITKRDSYSTAFMKGLGYEGIDVTGMKGLDNTTYGSVIYDLKGKDLERKKEIGTARYSKKMDAEYMDAYWDGDDDRMQELVDEAAYRAGYKYKAYHHTENGFTIFDLDKARKNMDIQGFYFFADADEGDEYGSVTYDTYLKMENPYIVDSREKQNAIPFDMSKDNAGVTAREWLQEQGYDSVIRKAEYFGAGADEYIVFDSAQIKSAEAMTFEDDEYGEGDIIPLSERFNEDNKDIRWSKKREPDIPEGYKERGFNESVRTKTDYDDIVQQEFIDNPEIYKQLANKVTKAKAKAIMDKGLAFAETEFPKLLERMDATAIALGDMMAREYSKMDQHDKAVTVIRDMAKQLTKAGQFSQAAVIALTKSNPMTALAYAKRDIDKLNADGHKQFGKKWKDFELTADEEEIFKNIKQGDADAIKAAYEKINKRIAKEYPSTIWQKFIEASRISMLLNPRTNVKNVVSNLLLYPVTRGSGILSSKLQKAYAYYNKDYKPNQSGLLKKEIRKQAEGVWEDIKDTFETANKYNEGVKANKRDVVVFKEGVGTRVMENIAPGTLHKLNSLMDTDDAGLMETLRHATYWLLEYGDNIFVKQNFISRFGSYMQAKGITDVNTMSEEDMAAAIDVAYREAMRATFKDDTALSKWMASIKHTGNIYIDTMMEMIMPFTKTPANIAMRGIDYSPIGFINTITKAKKGADASEVIDELSKNLLGSALIAFGAWLFSKGLVTGGEPENEKEAAFLKQQGWQPYAVKVGDSYTTYDWAQPAAIPIIMGVTIMESLEEGRLGVVDAVKNAGVASFNQWVELSPLQSLKEVMGGYGTVGENLLNTAIEMPQRLIPSALGATARTADTTQRLTYSKGNVAQTQKDLAKSKVPGLSQTLPAAYDTWGNVKKRDNSTGVAAINQFINPASYKRSNATEVDREIERLYKELGDSAVYPRKASYSIEKGGKTYTLSNAEYSEYQRIMGELSYDGVKALMAKPSYSSLSDVEKLEIIKDIYDNAFEKAKYTIMEGQGYKKTEEDIRTAKETKIKQAYLEATPENIAEYYIAYYILNNADSDKTANGTTIAGSKKKNGINRLVELGFTRGEAKRLYDRIKG